jgi:hypothetical protein
MLNIDGCFETLTDRIGRGMNFIEERLDYTTIYTMVSACLMSMTLAACFSSGSFAAMLSTLVISVFMKTEVHWLTFAACALFLLPLFSAPLVVWLGAVILSAVAAVPLGRYLAKQLVPGEHSTPAASFASLVPTWERLATARH